MTLFLLEFDRRTHTLVAQPKEFAESEREAALRERLIAQTLVIRGHLNRDVVLLEAESIEDLRRTHGSFFWSPADLAKRFGFAPLPVEFHHGGGLARPSTIGDMSRRPAIPTPASLPAVRAIELLQRQRLKADQLVAERAGEAAIETWNETTNDLLIRALGSGHGIMHRIQSAGIQFLNTTFASGDDAAIAFMKERIPFVDSAIEILGTMVESSPTPPKPQSMASTVFLVHGHDVGLRKSVITFIERITGSVPIVLQDQVNKGRTIIEKFEDHGGAAAYAVVLVTGDDIGGHRRGQDETDDALVKRLSPRARQNVVFEYGYFVGKIGREQVAVLYDHGTELPSDLQGLVWIESDPGEAWKVALAHDMEAAGLTIDWKAVAKG